MGRLNWMRRILQSYKAMDHGHVIESPPGAAHPGRAAIADAHLRILYGGQLEHPAAFFARYQRNLQATQTPVTDWKRFIRPERLWNLSCYARHALGLTGDWIECGVFLGLSALTWAQIRAESDPQWLGRGLVLVDSFEGLSPAVAQDGERANVLARAKAFRVDVEHVKRPFSPWPEIEWRRGWIPPVLDGLTGRQWSLVHLDVDLFEPIRDCLERLYPNLVPGGVIINDDYDSEHFPGARLAWDEFFLKTGKDFVRLPSGQAVYLHDGDPD